MKKQRIRLRRIRSPSQSPSPYSYLPTSPSQSSSSQHGEWCFKPFFCRAAISTSPVRENCLNLFLNCSLPSGLRYTLLSFAFGVQLKATLKILFWDIVKICPSHRRRRFLIFSELVPNYVWTYSTRNEKIAYSSSLHPVFFFSSVTESVVINVTASVSFTVTINFTVTVAVSEVTPSAFNSTQLIIFYFHSYLFSQTFSWFINNLLLLFYIRRRLWTWWRKRRRRRWLRRTVFISRIAPGN